MDIGLLIIATNKYDVFIQPLIDSADKYFLTNYNVKYFIFTDKDIDIKTSREVVKINIEHKPWPYITLERYKTFTNSSDILSKVDYLYYCDVDMRFVGEVGDEILGDRVGTLHPGYYTNNGTPERSPSSTAFISYTANNKYFAGGFNGGSSKEYVKMSVHLSKNIDIDLNKGIIAVWHDESHMNRYFFDNPPTVILSPSYCYPESAKIPFIKKLIALNKNHNEIRA